MTSRPPCSGNAFVYVLIAIVLFGGLSFALTRNQDSNPQGTITDAAAKTPTMQIFAYESSLRNGLNGMMSTGIDPSQIDFILPSMSGFNNTPTTHKFFHPDGGAVQHKALAQAAKGFPQTGPINGYYLGRFNNYVWTPTTRPDVIFSAYGISKEVCENINLKITGSKTIPVSSNSRGSTIDAAQGGGTYTNVDMNATLCPGCEDKPALCFAYTITGPVYSYYSILLAE